MILDIFLMNEAFDEDYLGVIYWDQSSIDPFEKHITQ